MGVLGVAKQGDRPPKSSYLCYTTFPNPEPLGLGWILAGCRRRRRSIKLILSDGHLTSDP